MKPKGLAKLGSTNLKFGSVTFSIEVYNSPNFDGWLGMVKARKGRGLWLVHRKLDCQVAKMPNRLCQVALGN